MLGSNKILTFAPQVACARQERGM